jgi:DNA-binding transcriptional ArsR family regulator
VNLLPLLDSPKSYNELLSVIGDQSALDITLSIHRKQGKIKLNEHGKWEIPKPPCMVDEELRKTVEEAAREANAIACREYRARHPGQYNARKREYYKLHRKELLAKARAKRASRGRN